jgi:dCMP deaminase
LPVCSDCAKGIIQVGIRNVFVLTDKPIPDIWKDSAKRTEEMFREAGVNLHYAHNEDDSDWIEPVEGC